MTQQVYHVSDFELDLCPTDMLVTLNSTCVLAGVKYYTLNLTYDSEGVTC